MEGRTIYEIGVVVKLIDRVTGGMSVITSAMRQAGGQTTALQTRLNALHDTLQRIQTVGAIGREMFTGAAGFIESTLDPPKELTHQINRMISPVRAK